MAEPALEFEGVSFTYPGARVAALQDVSLRVEPGERLGVLGPNGGGKSTLLRIALGLLRGHTGSVRVMGMTPERARKAGVIGYLPQKVEAELAFPLSGRQAVEVAASWREPAWRGPGAAALRRVERALDVVGAKEFAEAPVGALSGGQLQRVMIARALACDAKILALDEPLVGVDVAGQRMFAELLARLHAESGMTLIVVSHDIRSVAAGCDRVACLARTLHFHAAPRGLTPQVLAEVFSHNMEGVFGALHVDAHAAAGCAHEHGLAGASAPARTGVEVSARKGGER